LACSCMNVCNASPRSGASEARSQRMRRGRGPGRAMRGERAVRRHVAGEGRAWARRKRRRNVMGGGRQECQAEKACEGDTGYDKVLSPATVPSGHLTEKATG
jgi:hypothetical protein